ncbi:DNA-binding transcriptional regulator CsiR [Neptunomonas japonica]|uniref:GntR family transcriptional regulator, carbon starvation induced regulator n=1 Tax=Neptunomonas japonica JAMM 1380 TaxID=1441457 RepID=A0A7R6PJS0_9GAMM|nr:DNA-binding transcriptional regulator CsiR [Neptunomonas japonica]BBB30411.1 GntR family transcriptional regulator, carbon starvation induced regulator [Neptunomonas japonica JAMM 1380]
MQEVANSTADSKDNFASQVMGQLKQDILTGYFKPGEKLRMARLKERYQVGISPLREALSQLLIEQLVIVENQRGFRVHPISKEEMLDIYETRAYIEALCINLAIERGDDEWEAGILAAAHKMRKFSTLLEKEPHEWERRHQAFHSAIAEGCQSPTLLHVRRSLYEKASRYRNLWLKKNMLDNQIFDANQKEHDSLIEALLNHDASMARELIREHLLSPSRTLLTTEGFE